MRSCAPITELDFLEPSSSILVDVFADDDLNIHYYKRADISGEIFDSNIYVIVTDISKGFIGLDSEYTLTVKNDGNAFLTNNVTLDVGEEVFVGSTGLHKVFSENKMEFITISVLVPDESSPVFGSGTHSLTIIGQEELPPSVYTISRCTFSPEFGIVIDDLSAGLGEIGAPSVIDKRKSGTVDDTIISESFIERYIWGPRNDLRSNGVVQGSLVSDFIETSAGSGIAQIDISPGIAVVNGSRFEYLGDIELPYDYSGGSTNNFYVGINNHGCVVIGNEVDKTGGTDYVSPFSYETVLHLAYIDVDGSIGSSGKIYDLRFFIDRIDYKLSKEIIVSHNQNYGHFTNLESAINYCRLYSKIYKDLSSPGIFIKEGTYEVDGVIKLDFDISIKGSGPNTIIKRSSSNILFQTSLAGGNPGTCLIEIGDDSSSDNIQNGITLSDFTYRGLEGQATNVGGEVIRIIHNRDYNPQLALFRFSNIRFFAAEDYSVPVNGRPGTDNDGPNEMPFVIGRDAGHTFQNIIIENCYFYAIGYERGVIYLRQNNTFNNISVSNCILTDSLVSGYHIIRSPTHSTLNNVQEINSMITY